MKKTIFVLVYMLFARVGFAQQDILSFDEHNKYIYYKVVELPGTFADSLHLRGERFLKISAPPVISKTSANANSIKGTGKFKVFGGLVGVKHESGEIVYELNIEFKDQKYRFWLTDFVFTPYERDRYGNYVPKPGIEIPLEEAAAKLEKKQTEVCLNETGAFCKQFDERLKAYLINAPKKEEVAKKVVIDKW